jgi:hypothetical protein
LIKLSIADLADLWPIDRLQKKNGFDSKNVVLLEKAGSRYVGTDGHPAVMLGTVVPNIALEFTSLLFYTFMTGYYGENCMLIRFLLFQFLTIKKKHRGR